MVHAARSARARRDYLDAIDALDDADQRLRAQLARSRRLRQVVRRHIANGASAAQLCEVVDVGGARNDICTALDELLADRSRAQKAMYRLAAAEGMTAAQIARTWGVSRQLVSRILNGSPR